MRSAELHHVIAAAVLALSSLACMAGARPAKPAVSAAAATPVPSPADLQKEILALDDQRIAAMVAADTVKIGGFLRDDVTYIHSSGQLEGKAVVIDEIASGTIKYQGLEPSERTVRLYGDTAVVTGTATLSAVALGRALKFDICFTEVWVKAAGGWKLAAWESTRLAQPGDR